MEWVLGWVAGGGGDGEVREGKACACGSGWWGRMRLSWGMVASGAGVYIGGERRREVSRGGSASGGAGVAESWTKLRAVNKCGCRWRVGPACRVGASVASE